MQISTKEKNFCHDCGKKILFEGKKIKNGKFLVYENQGQKIAVFKCNDCFAKSQELKNYQPCEVYSRIVGYLRPVQQWNLGKQQEFKQRKEYKIKKVEK
ncbi:hypothetical protein H5T58_02680 [Candidatus Parcubacteria bacterium]|nr:hypothetical protein [Candidatus Parcubacteria bacterium]